MRLLLLTLLLLPTVLFSQWDIARPGKTYSFPADHYCHPDFKTEWWYFTGNLQAADGREFGYQITWFRQGIREPGNRAPADSNFVIDHLHFGHFAISDLSTGEHVFEQAIKRGAHGEAGTGQPGDKALVWVDPWTLSLDDDGSFRIAAKSKRIELDLHLVPTREPVFNGTNGVSSKAPGEGNGSHYYSYTRLRSSGRLAIDGREVSDITGSSWFDREWSTSVLGAEQIGWDWFSLNLNDGSDLMIYQLRERDGGVSEFSSGTLRRPDGTVVHLPSDSYTLKPGSTWKSKATGGEYPTTWSVKIPEEDIEFEVQAVFDAQELNLFPVTYWEGAVRVKGSHSGKGYMELTGYAGEVPLH